MELFRKGAKWWIVKALSLLGSVYLIIFLFEPFGIKVKQLGTTEVLIFGAILLFNSSLFEDADEMSFSSTGISLKRVREKLNEIDKAQSEQIAQIAELQKKQDETVKFLLKYLLTKYEVQHLEDLASERGVEVGKLLERLKEELHHLRGLDFIEGENISKLEEHIGKNIKDLGFKITEAGKNYLEQRKALLINSDSDNN